MSGRIVGSPMSEYGLEDLRSGKYDRPRINYSKKTKDGRILKSTSLYVKDENDNLIGYLCINMISELSIMKYLNT